MMRTMTATTRIRAIAMSRIVRRRRCARTGRDAAAADAAGRRNASPTTAAEERGRCSAANPTCYSTDLAR